MQLKERGVIYQTEKWKKEGKLNAKKQEKKVIQT